MTNIKLTFYSQFRLAGTLQSWTAHHWCTQSTFGTQWSHNYISISHILAQTLRLPHLPPLWLENLA